MRLFPLDRPLLQAIITDPIQALAPLCANAPAIAQDMLAAAEETISLYARSAAAPPFVTYLAHRGADHAIVGICAFVAPPREGAVEIAYFTFPPYERQGVAGAMAARLIDIAAGHPLCQVVTANTLPIETASTAILRRHGFMRAGTVMDRDEGEVWHWRRPVRAG